MFAHAMNKSTNGMSNQLLIEICLQVLGRSQAKRNISPVQKFEKACVSNLMVFLIKDTEQHPCPSLDIKCHTNHVHKAYAVNILVFDPGNVYSYESSQSLQPEQGLDLANLFFLNKWNCFRKPVFKPSLERYSININITKKHQIKSVMYACVHTVRNHTYKT